jgi:hypothetical protein
MTRVGRRNASRGMSLSSSLRNATRSGLKSINHTRPVSSAADSGVFVVLVEEDEEPPLTYARFEGCWNDGSPQRSLFC